MGTQKTAGFTIIETMLFLAISGLLIVTLIVSTGASINIQRYRDSAETFKSLLQQQYADLTSVENGRTDGWSCGSDAIPTDQGAAQKDNRGQSECILIGKYLRVENSDIAVYRVIGVSINSASRSNDIDSLKNNYRLNVSKIEVQESKLEWGTQISWPTVDNGVSNAGATSPRKFGMLIVRSPDSGQIYTFTSSSDDVPDKENIGTVAISNMLVAGNTVPGQGSQVICIDSKGMFVENDRSVYLNSFASGSSAVELRTNDFMKSVGINTKC